MKIVNESCTLVLVGNWNKYILSPDWLAKNIFGSDKLTLQFSANMAFSPRFSSPDVTMLPSDSSVLIAPTSPSDDGNLLKTEELAAKLLENLPHTPVSAFGINFGFIEESPEKDLLDIFNVSDQMPLVGFGCDVAFPTITRKIIYDGKIINLAVSHSDLGVTFEFNFHYDVADATDARAKITGQVIENKRLALALMHSVYSLEL